MRSLLLAASALVYLGSASLVCGLLFLESFCRGTCGEYRPRGTGWWYYPDSWQWEAMRWLSLSAGIAGITFLVLALFAARRPLIPWGALVVFAVLFGAALAFHWPTESSAPSDSQIAFLVTVGSGAALTYLSVSRQRAPTRRE